MLNLRPHILKAVTFVSGGKDSFGRPLPDTETVTEIPCRIESNGSASQVHYEDGVAHNYSFMVYLNNDCREFHVGDKVRLSGLDGNIDSDKEYEVLGFFRNQLNARLWV